MPGLPVHPLLLQPEGLAGPCRPPAHTPARSHLRDACLAGAARRGWRVPVGGAQGRPGGRRMPPHCRVFTRGAWRCNKKVAVACPRGALETPQRWAAELACLSALTSGQRPGGPSLPLCQGPWPPIHPPLVHQGAPRLRSHRSALAPRTPVPLPSGLCSSPLSGCASESIGLESGSSATFLGLQGLFRPQGRSLPPCLPPAPHCSHSPPSAPSFPPSPRRSLLPAPCGPGAPSLSPLCPL